MLSRHELSLKIYGGITDQSWPCATDCLVWLEAVLINDREKLKNDVVACMDEIPISMEYETDARDVWPKRWKKMLSILSEK